jgi:hypothetical protein
VDVVGNVEVEAARVGEIDEESAAGAAGKLRGGLGVELEGCTIVSEKHAGLGAGFVEGADEEVGEAVVVDVAPGGGVAADSCGGGEEGGGLCGVFELEGGVGSGRRLGEKAGSLRKGERDKSEGDCVSGLRLGGRWQHISSGVRVSC